MDTEALTQQFLEIYGAGPQPALYFAPGRVNLIGEHVDYNGGCVFPAALTLGTYGAVRRREDGKIRLFSAAFPRGGIAETDIDHPSVQKGSDWTRYPIGVVRAFADRGMRLPAGFDLLLDGTLPRAAGLSSSASVEVLTGYLLADVYGFSVSGEQLAQIAQEAENRFCGVSCGIMDPFAVAMGKEGCGIFLDTKTRRWEYVPLSLPNASWVITATNKRRTLRNSAYNDRRRECAEALDQLRQAAPISCLCDLSPEEFAQMKDLLSDETLRRRARHVVSENDRTIRAAEAAKRGDWETFGALLNESHRSLRDDYEVTGPQLDAIAEASWGTCGCIGARMTGAGFGGCAVALVQNEAVKRYMRQVGEAYFSRIGYAPSFYVASVGGGPVRL